MNARRDDFIPPHTLSSLRQFLQRSHSTLSPQEAVVAALTEWIERQRATSPRGMTLAIAGEGRNAWRDLWLRFPGERHWTNAARLRAQQVGPLAPSPADALTAAAKAMSQALNAAVTLIEHVDHQSTTVLERRLPRNRRAHDLLEDVH